jgi:hypothetical protein
MLEEFMDVYVGLVGSINELVFCKKIVYTSKHNTNHFSTFKMVHIMVFSFGISLVQLVDGPI